MSPTGAYRRVFAPSPRLNLLVVTLPGESRPGGARSAAWFEKRDELGYFVERVYGDIDGKPFRILGTNNTMNQRGVVIVTALHDGPAAQQGIQRGDIVLEYGDWRFFPQRVFDRSLEQLRLTMEQDELKQKRLLLFRAASSSVVHYDFGPGPIGLEILGSLWPGEDLKDIQEAHEEFVRERKTDGENEPEFRQKSPAVVPSP